LDLWNRHRVREVERERREALLAFARDELEEENIYAEQEDDEPVIMCTPPPTNNHAAAAVSAPSSGASTLSLVSGGSCSSNNGSPCGHYAVSHVVRRRIVHGAAHFVLYWRKTALGCREIATLPKLDNAAASEVTAAAASATISASPLADEEDEAVDMTGEDDAVLSQQSSANPVAPAAAVSSARAKSSSTTSPPIQAMDASLYETVEAEWFVREAFPELVALFEAEEAAAVRRKEQAKEQAQMDKLAAKQLKKDAQKAQQATKPPRGRTKKPLQPDAHTPSMALFLSPPTPSPAAATAEPPMEPAPAASKVAGTTSKAPTAVAPPLRRHNSSTAAVSSELTSLVRVQSTLMSFVKSKKLVDADEMLAAVKLAAAKVTLTAAALTAASPTGKKQTKTNPPMPSLTTKQTQQQQQQQQQAHKPLPQVVPAPAKEPQQPKPPVPSIPSVPKQTAPEHSSPRLLSAQLSVCPLCGSALPARLLDVHVNSCLDEQQMREDERMAAALAGPGSVVASSAAAAFFAQRSAPSSPVRQSATASAQSSPLSLTPQKRKLRQHGGGSHTADEDHGADADGAPLTDAAAAVAAALPLSAAAASARSPPRRALIDLLSSDDDEDDGEVCMLGVSSCATVAGAAAATGPCALRVSDVQMSDGEVEEDEQPGSTLYRKGRIAATSAARPQRMRIPL
jgi:hypothetical protein